MSAVEKMKKWQEDRQISNFKAAEAMGISELLYFKLLNGEVTHPKIAEEIQQVIGLTDLETEELMPKNYRKHGGCYDPGKYKYEPDIAPPVIPNSVAPINPFVLET